MSRAVTASVLAAAAVIGAAAGCWGGGPPYPLTGTVTYDGRPLPVGQIMFMPDANRANHGPGVVALVKDGRYEMPRGKGHIGGPYVAEVTGFDGVVLTGVEGPVDPRGKGLFQSYAFKIDLPPARATYDFAVPAQVQRKASTGPPR